MVSQYKILLDRRFGIAGIFLGILFESASVLAASAFSVSIDTALLSGAPAQLAFDFTDGGLPSNTLTIQGFSTDGTLGAVTVTGGVSGTLPGAITLNDTELFNEYLTDIDLGSHISFQFQATANLPESGSFPDSFSVFLLDPVSGLSLISTVDVGGALLRFDINGAANDSPTVFSEKVTVVPLPGAGWLLVSGLGLLSWIGRKRAIADA